MSDSEIVNTELEAQLAALADLEKDFEKVELELRTMSRCACAAPAPQLSTR
jgi:hypothetical protein